MEGRSKSLFHVQFTVNLICMSLKITCSTYSGPNAAVTECCGLKPGNYIIATF